MLTNVSLKVYSKGREQASSWIQVEQDQLETYVRQFVKREGCRIKTYEKRTYPGLRPVYHEVTATKGLEIVAHEVYV